MSNECHLSKQYHNYSNNIIWNFISQVRGLSLGDRGWWCFFTSSFLTQFGLPQGPSWAALRHRGLHVHSLPGLCAHLWPYLHVSSGENSGDLITTLKWYKNLLKPSLRNTLFHILDDENSTHSTCSLPIYTAFLETSTHHSRVIPVRPKIWPAQKHIHYFSDDGDQ